MKDKLDKATLRLKLRKLYDDSPKEFERIVEQLQGMAVAKATMGPDPNGIPLERTADYLDWVLPPIKIVRGKAAKLEDYALAALLAEYRLRAGSREEFVDQTQHRQFSNGYSSWGRINVEEHLKTAEKREKCDATFAESVQTFVDVFTHLRVGALPPLGGSN